MLNSLCVQIFSMSSVHYQGTSTSYIFQMKLSGKSKLEPSFLFRSCDEEVKGAELVPII